MVATGVDFEVVEDELVVEDAPEAEVEVAVELLLLFGFVVLFFVEVAAVAEAVVVGVADSLGVAEVVATGTETMLLAPLVRAPPVRGEADALNPVELCDERPA